MKENTYYVPATIDGDVDSVTLGINAMNELTLASKHVNKFMHIQFRGKNAPEDFTKAQAVISSYLSIAFSVNEALSEGMDIEKEIASDASGETDEPGDSEPETPSDEPGDSESE